ncbi:DUF1343 domain-containing protein [Parapedobacter sp. ISTM3]|nr:DUF1343 domain-containing protein [Parapedobacter sp. ISTM3]
MFYRIYSVIMRVLRVSLVLTLMVCCVCGVARHADMPLVPGANRMDVYLPLLEGKGVGLAINQSSLVDGTRLIDTLLSSGVHVVRAFGPEHGVSGQTSANRFVAHGTDERTGVPVTSLFGAYYKPTKQDLEGIDVMVFDMQDVGVRFYTYISTLHYVMEACAENHIAVIVLDRPNPNDGYIDGPVLEPACQSFIGMHPIPVVHGMTMGEYARMINGQGWLHGGLQCPLTVISMLNYRHGMDDELPVPPSPNLNTQRSIYLYPSLCWFGGTAISDGRGTYTPFQLLGSPALRGKYAFSFVPQAIHGMSEHPMHAGDTCYGLDLRGLDLEAFRATKRLNLRWLLELYEAYPDKANFFNREAELGEDAVLHFDQQAGTQSLRKQLKAGYTEAQIRESWEPALNRYRGMRKKYLLYE